jgi:PD-(D/E)XK nuclease superfamily protein
MAKPFAWSFSALTRYENCPKQYFHLNVAKDFKDEDSEWAADGKIIHDGLYGRVVKGKPLPLPIRHMEPMAAKFANAEGEKHGEMKLALNRKFEPVDFFAPDVWVRSVVDLLIIRENKGIIVDWKTGKVKDDFTQLMLTAGVLSRYMPELDIFEMVYVWTKSREVTRKNITLSRLTEMWNGLLPRVGKIEDSIRTTTFPARESGLCRYCPVRTCPHWQSR